MDMEGLSLSNDCRNVIEILHTIADDAFQNTLELTKCALPSLGTEMSVQQ